MIKHCIVLAAGNGTRLMPLTAGTTKAMVSVNGQALISYTLRQLDRIEKLSVTVGAHSADLVAYLQNYELSEIFDTSGHDNAWWLFNTYLNLLNEPVLVLPCDNLVRLDLRFLMDEYSRLGQPACMIVPVSPVHGIEGDYLLSTGSRVIGMSRDPIAQLYASGIQILNPFVINSLINKVDDFSGVWDGLIRKGLLTCSQVYPHPWFSVNSPEHIAKFEAWESKTDYFSTEHAARQLL